MNSEEEIRLKIRKIEALFSGSEFIGERDAAEAALKRIKETLANNIKTTPALEYTFTFDNQWSKKLFTASCRRYELRPYRYARQRRTTVMVRAPEDFVEKVLWPEHEALNNVLREYINQMTEKIITEEIHCDTTEAQEIAIQLLEAS
jgi:predicted SPOUT superfamily RNA methylase MTH1